jgi:hypothetical protein
MRMICHDVPAAFDLDFFSVLAGLQFFPDLLPESAGGLVKKADHQAPEVIKYPIRWLHPWL